MRFPTSIGSRPILIVLICLQKAVWGLSLLAFAAVLLILHTQHQTQPLQLLFAQELAEDPHDFLANLAIGLVPAISPTAELALAIGALLYAILEGIEAWGVWNGVHWLEALVILETAALLPYDLWELAVHVSWLKLLELPINAFVVWYLARRYLDRRKQSKSGLKRT